MKKISAIMAAFVAAAAFMLAGCQKQEAQKPAEQSSMTSTAADTMSAPTATDSGAPAMKHE